VLGTLKRSSPPTELPYAYPLVVIVDFLASLTSPSPPAGNGHAWSESAGPWCATICAHAWGVGDPERIKHASHLKSTLVGPSFCTTCVCEALPIECFSSIFRSIQDCKHWKIRLKSGKNLVYLTHDSCTDQKLCTLTSHKFYRRLRAWQKQQQKR
jgi:hypothetical protein